MENELVDAASQNAVVEGERFVFGRAGNLGGDHQRTIRALDDQFSRNLTYTLGAWLRTNAAVSALPCEETTYFAFAERSATSEFAMPVRMEPSHVRGCVSLDLTLVPSIVDLLLGGSGRPTAAPRELTEIEEAIVHSVFEIVVRELNAAWRSTGSDFRLERREDDSREQRLMLATEKVLVLQYEVLMPELRGSLRICLPAASLNTLFRKLTNRHRTVRVRTAEERLAATERLAGAKTSAILQFPSMRITTRELNGMRAGRLLPLGLPVNVVGSLRVGGVHVVDAEPVCVGERRGAKLISNGGSDHPMFSNPELKAE